ncbi:hypothetical protein GIB67_004280 [Kingdonia uniflora]|uniref:Uncharacterized protein n=1 Tax=Kingdonia uniflora TaxID=39325 RepID=A0A7J7MRE2_9MAGN|nr:hypothetical protein GIB67_004280 [Kingdonia uniflora]
MGMKSDKKKNNKKEKKKESGGVQDYSTTNTTTFSGKNNGSQVITVPRFSSVHPDPRFQEVPRKQSKVAIDSVHNDDSGSSDTESGSDSEELKLIDELANETNTNLTTSDMDDGDEGVYSEEELVDLKELLASDDDDNDGDGQSEKKTDKSEKYRALLTAGNNSDVDTEYDKDMEVAFNTGLEGLNKPILVKKNDEGSETVWNTHLKKKSEKNKVRKNKSKDTSEDVSTDNHDLFIQKYSGMAKSCKEKDGESSDKDVFGTAKSCRKEKHEIGKEQEGSISELELLPADDSGGDPGLKSHNLKPKKSKGKKGKEVPAKTKIPNIDPQYERSAPHALQFAKKQHNSVTEKIPGQAQVPLDDTPLKKDTHSQSESMSSKKEKLEPSSLDRSVKRKFQQIQVPSSSPKASMKQKKCKLFSSVEPVQKNKK